MASHSTISYSVLLFCLRVRCWLPPPFKHAAPLSSAPPSVPSSPSSQSGAPTVDEGEPTVPQDGEGEKCVCVHCNAGVHTHSFICTAAVDVG